MPKMMGKGKHWGRWYIDAREPNRAARAQEARQTAAEASYGILDWSEDQDAPTAPENPPHAPGSTP